MSPKGNATQQAYRFRWKGETVVNEYMGLTPSSKIMKPDDAIAALYGDGRPEVYVHVRNSAAMATALAQRARGDD